MPTKKVIHKTNDEAGRGGMEFILSDATVDRYGDIIEAEGWQLDNFNKNPVALFSHRADFPIGQWENLRIADGALRGHLRMAPAGSSSRIDEIRSLVEAGILKAVSVGFTDVESQPIMQDTKYGPTMIGYHYQKTELIECSVVSVGANPNALAVAKSLKISDDTLAMVFAEHGDKKDDQIKRRGVNGGHAEKSENQRRGAMTSPTIAKRIEDTQERINKLKAQFAEHVNSINDETPDETATQVSEELNNKIEAQQKNLENLKKAEKQLAITADPVDRPVISAAAVSSARPFAVAGKKLVPTDYLWRALTVAIKHHVEGRQRPILEVLKSTYGEDEPTRVVMANLITKAAVAPADTVTTHWAPELVQTVIGNLIESLFPVSIYPALASRGGSFTFGRNGTISLPKRDPTPTLAGGFVAQGAAIPVKAASFTSITLTPKKVGVITTLTREIAEHSTPSIEAIVRQAILDDTAVAIDTALTDAVAATTTRPAGLKAGVSKVNASATASIVGFIADITGLASALITNTAGNVRKPVWIMNPGDVLKASLLQTTSGDMPFRDELAGGTLAGYPILQSTTGTADTMFLVDAADFITATGDTPNFAVSDQAVLHMEDTTPLALATVGSPNVVAAPSRSLWQTDTMAIRLIMDINWAMQRTGTVQWTDTLAWN